LTGRWNADPNGVVTSGEDRFRDLVVEYVAQDSDTGLAATQTLGVAKVVLPNGAPCPVWAGLLFYWHDLGKAKTSTDAAHVVPVIVRHDTTASAGAAPTTPGEVVCGVIVANVVVSATVQGLTSSGTLNDPPVPVPLGQEGFVSVSDQRGNTLALILVHLAAGINTLPAQVGSTVLLTARVLATDIVGATIPANPPSGPYCWLGANVGLTAHSHLTSGAGVNGGGVAFACFAPSTKAEAISLGYTDLP
jgi:hypothetical protein